MKMKLLIILILLLAGNISYSQIYNINSANSLFTPTYRDQANTTYFEWTNGEFYGWPVPPTSSRILDNTPPTLGITSGVEFYQNDRYSSTPTIIGSSSGNIYTGFGANGKQAFATLVIPASPGIGVGNTTLFIQGRTVPESGFAPADQLIINYPRFTLNGISPTFNIGINANREGQWYALFDVNSSATSFSVDIEFPGGPDTYPISIANLSVDSLWTPIPEPSTLFLIFLSIGFIIFRHIRSQVGLKRVSKTLASS
jgi:hypothetical protein